MVQKTLYSSSNIGLVIYALDRNPSGIGHYVLGLLQGFQSIGVSPLLLQAGGSPQGQPRGGAQVAHLPMSGLLPALLTLGQVEIGQVARKRSLHLVHDPHGIAPLALCPGRRIVTLHDVFPLSFPGHSALAETIIYRYWLPLIAPSLDAVITDSQCSKKDICKYLPMPEKKVTVIAASSNPYFRPLDGSLVEPVLARYSLQRPYILYVGSVEPRKNLLRLLEAFVLLHRVLPHYRLVIVGAGNVWKSSPIAKAVVYSGMQDQVIFTGYIPDADLPFLYNGADLFCFPSLYEGFGLPVLEAMACGTPVVTSNTSSLPEVAGDAALLVDPYNVEEIFAAMRRALEDTDLAHQLRQKGLERSRQFSWERTARETIAVYEKVLGEKLL